MTRARDRLYLAATLTDGRFVPCKGGLGRTLPPSLAVLFDAAAHVDGSIAWQGPTASHTFRVLRPAAAASIVESAPAERSERADDFAPLAVGAPERRVVTDLAQPGDLGPAPPGTTGSSIDVGVLVHRALDLGTDDLEPLLRPDERALVAELPQLLADAQRALACLRAHPLFAEAMPERTFCGAVTKCRSPAAQADGTLVRGTIDCVVKRADGAIDVFEFKTGRRSGSHLRQLDAYVKAARQLFPDSRVTGHLIYADAEQLSPTPGV